MAPYFDIICFAKDWNEPKTSNNHLMEEFARQGYRVLWVNPLPMRTPSLSSAHDRKKILRKLRGWFRGIDQITNNLRVLHPILVPLPRSGWAQRFNRWFVGRQVRRAAQRWGFHQPQLWIFPPNAVDYVGQLGESKVVYYCTDEWSQFRYINADFMRHKEMELLRCAHIVFVSSQPLLSSKGALHPRVHLMPHGVNHALFAQALSPDLPIPADLQQIRTQPSALSPQPSPIIGFYGNLYGWVNLDLLTAMAQARPKWSFVLVGKIMTDVKQLQNYANVHLTGFRPYEELPRFCKGFDVGLIPYRVDDPRMQTVNPLKLREYLAAGVPVVSVEMQEVRHLHDNGQLATTDLSIATGSAEFIHCIEAALAADSPAAHQRRSDLMKSESWTTRVAQIKNILAEA